MAARVFSASPLLPFARPMVVQLPCTGSSHRRTRRSAPPTSSKLAASTSAILLSITTCPSLCSGPRPQLQTRLRAPIRAHQPVPPPSRSPRQVPLRPPPHSPIPHAPHPHARSLQVPQRTPRPAQRRLGAHRV